MPRPDTIYWRWSYRAPVQFIPWEDVWFYPGPGPCVDGYYWWHTKKHVKRLDLETWKAWGRKKSGPPTEHPQHDAFQEKLQFGKEAKSE